MNKPIIFFVVAIVVIAGIGLLIFKSPALAPTPNVVVDVKQNVENYLRENISTLSPVKAVLGGTWYVVSDTVDLSKNSGTVTYEDGHIQEIKNFSYTTNTNGDVVSLIIANVPNPVACTQESKLCPDGSAVGRTGSNCEFALCGTGSGVPPVSKKSGVSGVVTLGPTCPVERIPPDPNCAPRFYSTSIAIYEVGHTNAVKTIQSDTNGAFSAELNPGNYTLETRGENLLPRCGSVSVEVKSGQYVKAEISCDTGIR